MKQKILIFAAAIFALIFTSCGTVEKLTKSGVPETNSADNSSNSNGKPTRNLTKWQKELPKEIVNLVPFDFGRFTQIDGYKISDNITPNAGEKGSYSARYLLTYNYADGRFKKYHKDDVSGDLRVKAYKFDSPEKVADFFKKELFDGNFSKAIPEEKYRKMRMCSEREAEKGTADARPYIITKTLPNPRGGDLQVIANGFHLAGNCRVDPRNSGGYAIWTDGVYAFMAESTDDSEMKTGGQGLDNVTDFANDYAAAMK